MTPLYPLARRALALCALALVLLMQACGPAEVKNCDGACKDNEECINNEFCLPKCAESETRCGTSCANTKNDAKHCGACDSACKDSETCNDGKCEAGASCGSDETDCSGTCANTKNDAKHCGACGNACKDGETCKDGTCETDSPCIAGETECGGTCVDTQSDADHCGACDTKCGTGKTCNAGTCECQTGQTDCGGTCVDTDSSDDHCGACDNKCSSPQYCDVGQCACPSNQSNCSGTCVDIGNSNDHCGACDNKCPTDTTCVSGSCECSAGKTLCSGTCIDTQTDDKNCGNCGNTCASGETCKAGKCESSSTCTAPEVDCNGTCINTQTDKANCGSCGNACASGESCDAGTCKSGCTAPKTDCSGSCVDTQTDKAHCGSCGNACASGETCKAGKCESNSTCTAPEVDCNGTCVNTQTDDKNCGSCGKACASGENCSAGTCTTTCASPKTVCSGSCVDTQTNASHCGTCGNACASGESCVAGACKAPCTAPEVSCSGTCVNTQTSNANCGSCGNACPTGQTCQAGSCACPGNKTACGNVCVDTTADINHCGACNNACSGTGISCFNSKCSPTWLYVSTGDKSTKTYGITANNLGNVYSVGERLPTSGQTLYLLKNDSNGTATDLSVTKHQSRFGLSLSQNTSVTQTGWVQLKGWQTSQKVEFQVGNDVDVANGVFTAPANGYYFFTAGASFSNANNANTGSGDRSISLSLGINGTVSAEHGAYSKATTPKSLHPLEVQGVFKLSKGDKVTLHAHSQRDNSYTIGKTTFFSGYHLGATLPHGFHVDLSAAQSYSNNAVPKGWRATGEPGLFLNGNALDMINGVYTAPIQGYYYFSARLQLTTANNPTVEFQINGARVDTTFRKFKESRAYDGTTMVTGGVLYLSQGDKVRLRVTDNTTTSKAIASQSGFTGFLLATTLAHGVHTQIASNQNVTSSAQLKGFAAGNTSGRFAQGSGFDGTNGEFAAPVAGDYLIYVQATFNNLKAGTGVSPNFTTLEIQYNGSSASDAGLSTRWQSTANEITIGHTQILRLAKGDKLSLSASNAPNSGFQVGRATTFTAILLDPTTTRRKSGAVATDSSDNLYLMSHVEGSIALGDQLLRTDGAKAVVAKRKTDGTWLWIRSYAPSDSHVSGIHAVGSGESVICGEYNGAWTYATGKSLPAPTSGNNGYVARLDTNGDVKWAVAIESNTSQGLFIDCAVSPSGEIFVKGYAVGAATLGSINFTGAGAGKRYLYLARVKADGSGFAWAKEFDEASLISGLAADSSDNLYVVGTFDKSFDYDGTNKLTSARKELFVLSADKDGKFRWSHQTRNLSGDITARGIALSSNTVYYGGHFSGALIIDGAQIPRTAAQDVVLGTLDLTGKPLWAKSVGGNNSDVAPYLATDGNDHLYMAIQFNSPSLSFNTLTATKKQTNASESDTVITKNLP